MPRDSLPQFDRTATNNTDITGISTAPGWSPANVGPAFRSMMGLLANYAIPFTVGVSGTNTLTAAQASGTLINTGGTGGTLVVPQRPAWGWLWNSCTGAVVLTTGSVGGNNVTVPTGLTAFWYCPDGISIYSPTFNAALGALPSLVVAGAATVGGLLTANSGINSAAISATTISTSGAAGFNGQVVSNSNIYALGEVGTIPAGAGGARLSSGGPSNNGYLSIYAPNGSRQGFIGFGTTTLNLQADGSNAWNIAGSSVTLGSFVSVAGPLNTTGRILINNLGAAGGLYYSNFNGNEWHSYVEDSSADKITQYRVSWYDRWENATGTRRWASPAGYMMSLDGSGNLSIAAAFTTAGNVNCHAIQLGAASFFISPDSGRIINFDSGQYLQFLAGDGFYWNCGGTVHINVPTLQWNGVNLIRNDGATYTINITGSAGSAGTAGSAGSAGFASTAGSMDWSGLVGDPRSQSPTFHALASDTFIATNNGSIDAHNGNLSTTNDCNVGGQVNTQRCFVNAAGFCLNLPNGAGIAAGGFVASDARWKTDIRPITADEAIARVRGQRLVRFRLEDQPWEMAGVLAQEEEAAERGDFVRWADTDDQRAKEGDEHSPAGKRAYYDYNSQLAMVTRALQDALARIEHLERLVTK